MASAGTGPARKEGAALRDGREGYPCNLLKTSAAGGAAVYGGRG